MACVVGRLLFFGGNANTLNGGHSLYRSIGSKPQVESNPWAAQLQTAFLPEPKMKQQLKKGKESK
jgi:hypothetical protein